MLCIATKMGVIVRFALALVSCRLTPIKGVDGIQAYHVSEPFACFVVCYNSATRCTMNGPYTYYSERAALVAHFVHQSLWAYHCIGDVVPTQRKRCRCRTCMLCTSGILLASKGQYYVKRAVCCFACVKCGNASCKLFAVCPSQ